MLYHYFNQELRLSHIFFIFFLFLGLRESLPYDFSPSGKIKFALQFPFLFYVPTL